MDDPPLASLSLTHVHYNPHDPISHACAWLALVPQALCVTYATLIWSTREVEVLLMFAGQMACEAFNWLLKRYIKEERPRQMNGKGYGMPSSHAQFLAFFAVYLTLFLLFRHAPSTDAEPHGRITATPLWQRVVLSLLLIAFAYAEAVSRVYLHYHTPRQVLVGVIAGVSCGVAWFLVTAYMRRSGWLEWGLETSLARDLRLRDLVVGEDVSDAGWLRWETRRFTKRSQTGSGTEAVGNGSAKKVR